MSKKTVFLISLFLITLIEINGQNHYFGIKIGYNKSMATSPNNQVNFNGNDITVSQGTNWFKGIDGFQIGISSNIDIGYDFLHLDIAPLYSKYGFDNNQKFQLDYFDLDIGFSNMNSEVPSKFVVGIGLTPSLVISSKNLNNINDFDLRVYMILGYRFYKNYVIYTQLRYGLIELIPESKIRNFQLSLNINIPILKLKK